MAELIYSKKCTDEYDDGVTYIFYDDMTYRCEHWPEKDDGRRWRVEDSDVFVIQSDGGWHNVSKYNVEHPFVSVALHVYRHVQWDKEIDEVLLGKQNE